MADFEFENPVFDEDDIDIDEPIDPPIDPSIDFAPPIDPSIDFAPGDRVQPLQQELLQTAVDQYYDALSEQGFTPSTGRDYSKFELVRGELRLRAHPEIDLINSRTKRPLRLSTIRGRRGGATIIRDELGFSDWSRKPLPAAAATALNTLNKSLGEAAANVETVELQELGQVATKASQEIELETSLADIDLREIRGLDKALQSIRGELTNNLAKLTELDDHINKEQSKLDRIESEGGIDEATKRRITDRLRELQDERASRREAASANRDALRTQINRVRETINRILNEDTTLAERIRTLFREQGITIASIITAVGMAITALVFALTGKSSSPPPTPPDDKKGVKEWIKKHLQNLGQLLAKLAGKAAAALPGIIGSIISWFLTLLSKTANWLASNLWAIVIAVGGILIIEARKWLIKNPKGD